MAKKGNPQKDKLRKRDIIGYFGPEMKERRLEFKELKITPTMARAISLRTKGISAHLSTPGEGLFRIRVGRGARLGPDYSWSVLRGAPSFNSSIRTSGKEAEIATSAAILHCDLSSGGIFLRDRFGFDIFHFPAGALNFCGQKAQVAFPLGEHEKIFGLGETTGTWNKRGLIRELWNIDVLGHAPGIHPGLKSLYVSIPFIVTLQNGRAAGLFWDNPARQVWEVGQPEDNLCRVTADSGEINLYLFTGPRLPEILRAYTTLTGRMKMPPIWSLGYHQSRYSYSSAKELEAIAAEFRQRQIPCDALYLDIDHMNGYRVFTFGKSFPKASATVARLHREGFKIIPIVDPGVKKDRKFGVFQRGAKGKFFVRDDSGKKDFVGKVWPGESCFPDFTKEPARQWWAKEQGDFQKRFRLDGFWNDMNEPANFAAPHKTLDLAARHETDFGPRTHAPIHNVYGMQMARASAEGALQCVPDRRPFIIARAGYAGIQRHALVWTGDVTSAWEHLADSVQMLLNLGLSGVANCGADIGGFLGHSTGELLARWTQLAAFTPFFRNHSDKASRPQEPWRFGLEVEAICRRYIELRYQLLPYLYCLLAEAAREGTPMMRPLLWHYQNDERAASIGDQFLLGPFMMVAPILQQGGRARSVYLPPGRWYSFWTGQEFAGGQHSLVVCDLQTIPLLIRAGSIIPFQPVQQFVSENKFDTMTLHIWPGRPGELDWYEDDGFSNEYLREAFHRRKLSYREIKRQGHLEFGAVEGNYSSSIKSWRIVFHTAREIKNANVGKEQLPSQYVAELGLFIFDVPNSAPPFTVSWR